MNVLLFGRPNVGKSSIFNLLTKTNDSLVSHIPGSTVDFKKGIITLNNQSCFLYDVVGYDKSKQINYLYDLLSISDLVLFVIEAGSISSYDYEIYNILIKSNKPILMLANKVDICKDMNIDINLPFMFISSYQKYRQKLLEKIFSFLPSNIKVQDYQIKIPCIILGKPNAGKSCLMNAILSVNRCIVSSIPGTTTDTVSECFTYNNKVYEIIDSAGISRNITNQLFDQCLQKTKKVLKQAELVLMVVDAQEEVNRQDMRIMTMIKNNSKSFILVINKSDLGINISLDHILHKVRMRHIILSAKYKTNIDKLLYEIDTLFIDKKLDIPSDMLSYWLNSILKIKEMYKMYNPRIIKELNTLLINCKKIPNTNHKQFLKSSFMKYFKINRLYVNISYKKI